jgi:CHRD domain
MLKARRRLTLHTAKDATGNESAAKSFEASLTGEKEVPGPGDKDGRGETDVTLYKAKACYELEVERIKPTTAAHIHRGGPSVAGPIVVELKAPTEGSSEGCKAISTFSSSCPYSPVCVEREFSEVPHSPVLYSRLSYVEHRRCVDRCT